MNKYVLNILIIDFCIKKALKLVNKKSIIMKLIWVTKGLFKPF